MMYLPWSADVFTPGVGAALWSHFKHERAGAWAHCFKNQEQFHWNQWFLRSTEVINLKSESDFWTPRFAKSYNALWSDGLWHFGRHLGSVKRVSLACFRCFPVYSICFITVLWGAAEVFLLPQAWCWSCNTEPWGYVLLIVFWYLTQSTFPTGQWTTKSIGPDSVPDTGKLMAGLAGASQPEEDTEEPCPQRYNSLCHREQMTQLYDREGERLCHLMQTTGNEKDFEAPCLFWAACTDGAPGRKCCCSVGSDVVPNTSVLRGSKVMAVPYTRGGVQMWARSQGKLVFLLALMFWVSFVCWLVIFICCGLGLNGTSHNITAGHFDRADRDASSSPATQAWGWAQPHVPEVAEDPKGWLLERLNTQKFGLNTAPGGKQWLMEGAEISVSVIQDQKSLENFFWSQGFGKFLWHRWAGDAVAKPQTFETQSSHLEYIGAGAKVLKELQCPCGLKV